jgi:hypothetical protein
MIKFFKFVATSLFAQSLLGVVEMKVESTAINAFVKDGSPDNVDSIIDDVAAGNMNEYPLCAFGPSMDARVAVPKKVGHYRAYQCGYETMTTLGGEPDVASHVSQLRVRKIAKDGAPIPGCSSDMAGDAYKMLFKVTDTVVRDLERRLDTKRGNQAIQ